MSRRILICDDEPMVLRVLQLQLENAGDQVDTAPNGRVALEIIEAHPPDALVTDIEMPQMSGEELCKHLHEHHPDRDFPIFIATSLTAIRHRDWSERLDNVTFLEKPLSAKKLLAALKTFFASQEQVEPQEQA